LELSRATTWLKVEKEAKDVYYMSPIWLTDDEFNNLHAAI
jgi:hypothetical protein